MYKLLRHNSRKGRNIVTTSKCVFIKIKYIKTNKEILSAIIALADKTLSVTIPFRGYDIVFMDTNVRAYKGGNCVPLIVEWEEITPVEAMRLLKSLLLVAETNI